MLLFDVLKSFIKFSRAADLQFLLIRTILRMQIIGKQDTTSIGHQSTSCPASIYSRILLETVFLTRALALIYGFC